MRKPNMKPILLWYVSYNLQSTATDTAAHILVGSFAQKPIRRLLFLSLSFASSTFPTHSFPSPATLILACGPPPAMLDKDNKNRVCGDEEEDDNKKRLAATVAVKRWSVSVFCSLLDVVQVQWKERKGDGKTIAGR
jgi:hypothetical protein